MSDAESSKKPSSKKLKQFIDKGGYALLERAGTGTTTEERQNDAWNQYGIMNELMEQTGLAKTTLYLIREWFPTQNEAGFEMFWISKKNINLLNEAREKLLQAEKILKRINEIADRSLIVDSTTVRMQQVVMGISAEEAFKNVVKASEKMDNPIKEHTNELKSYLSETKSLINDVQFSAKEFQK